MVEAPAEPIRPGDPEPDDLFGVDPEPAAAVPVLHRIRSIAVGAYVVFAIYALISMSFRAFLGLTCTAAVVMIHFLWLEEIVNSILQPAPRLHAWRLMLRTLARFALLGAALSVTIFVAGFNGLSVLLGFSIVVVGIIGEALYSAYRVLAGT